MIKTGVIGVGHMGQHHARILSEIKDSNLVGVCDIDENRGKEISKKVKCKYFKDRNKLLEETEAIIIASPTMTHYEIALDAIKRGNHILVEKPISFDLNEADDIIEKTEENGLKLLIGHVERFNPALIAAEEKIEQPLFIEAHRLSPFYGRGTDVSVVLDLMVHDIDITIKCVNSPIEHISAAGVPVITDSIDIAHARLEFENGSVANITASRISLSKLRKIRFWQKYSYVSVDTLNENVYLYKRVINDGIPEIVDEEIEVGKDEPLNLEVSSFVDSCLGKNEISIPPSEARQALATAYRILKCIEDRAERVDIELSPDYYRQ